LLLLLKLSLLVLLHCSKVSDLFGRVAWLRPGMGLGLGLELGIGGILRVRTGSATLQGEKAGDVDGNNE